MKPALDSALRFLVLSFGILLLSSCQTATGSRLKAAMSWLIHSRMASQRPATAPIQLYCNAYWRAVGDEQTRRDSQYKRTQRFSGAVDTSRDGFRCGTVEIDYEISRMGVMTIKDIRTSDGLLKAQVKFGTSVMKKAAASLKPFPPNLASVAGETIHDTMVFEFR
jgi:hypothetical protein